MANTAPKRTGVHVQASGEDGNVFSILARVKQALNQAGHPEAGKELVRRLVIDNEAEDFDHALRIIGEYVELD